MRYPVIYILQLLMKKLLNTSIDILLFSVLIVILLVPFVISLNLDPKLYEKSSNNVAGVISVNDSLKNYIQYTDEFSSNERLFFKNSIYKQNTYKIQFRLSRGENFENDFYIGTLQNHSDSDKYIYVNLLGDKDKLADMTISALVDDKEYVLSDAKNLTPNDITISPNTRTGISLQIYSKYNLNYEQDFTLEIKPVNIK